MKGKNNMTVGIILDYQIRKSIHLIEISKSCSANELIAVFEEILNKYIQTEEGNLFFEKNNERITLHDFMKVGANIPDKLCRAHGISFSSSNCMSEDVIEIQAFTPIIQTNPVMACFGVYDQDYQINKSDLMRLIDSVNWSNDYAFRDLHYKDRLVGFGFVSMDLIDPIDETEFNLEEFLNGVAEIAYTTSVEDPSIHELQGISFKMLRLDW